MIKRLSLYNFKSITKVDIDFSPLTVLIGRSGTGKTNIVDGIRFWRDYLIQKDWSRHHSKWTTIYPARGSVDTFGFEMEFSIPRTPGEFIYRLFFGAAKQPGNHPAFREESLTRAGATVFHQGAQQWVHPPSVMDTPKPGQPALGLLYGLREAQEAYSALTQGIGCYDFSADVLRSNNKLPADGRNGLTDGAENYLNVFETVSSALGTSQPREIVAALRQLTPTLDTLEIDTRDRNKIYVGHRTSSGLALTLELAQQSEGFRRFLAHLLALYQIPSKPVLIFEEAEKGIYPGALAALADHFKSVTQRETSQVIITSHSPQLLDHFPVESVRVVDMEDYQTRVGHLDAAQIEAVKKNLLEPGELLTADPARLEKVA